MVQPSQNDFQVLLAAINAFTSVAEHQQCLIGNTQVTNNQPCWEGWVVELPYFCNENSQDLVA